MSETWSNEQAFESFDWNAYEDYMDDLYEYDGQNDLDEFEVQCQREADDANGVWAEDDPWVEFIPDSDPPF